MPDCGAGPAILAENVNWWSGWKLIGDFTTIDLIAVEANAHNGAFSRSAPTTTRTSPPSASR